MSRAACTWVRCAVTWKKECLPQPPDLWLPAGPHPEEFILDQGAPLGEWCSSFCFFFPTCICTNFNFLRLFLIFELLPCCILIKGNYLQGHSLGETKLGNILFTGGAEFALWGSGLPWITLTDQVMGFIKYSIVHSSLKSIVCKLYATHCLFRLRVFLCVLVLFLRTQKNISELLGMNSSLLI